MFPFLWTMFSCSTSSCLVCLPLLFQFEVFAEDHGSSPLRSNAAPVSIGLVRNQYAPLFSQEEYIASMREDEAPGHVVINVTASDLDPNVIDHLWLFLDLYFFTIVFLNHYCQYSTYCHCYSCYHIKMLLLLLVCVCVLFSLQIALFDIYFTLRLSPFLSVFANLYVLCFCQ